MSPSADKWLLVQLTNGDTREVISSSILVNPLTDVNIGSEVVIVRRGGDMETAKILCSSRHRDVLLEQISPVKINQQTHTAPIASGSKPREEDVEDPYASSGSSWAPDQPDSTDSESELEIAEERNNNLNHPENPTGKKKKVMKPSMRADAIINVIERKRKLQGSTARGSEPANKRFSVQIPSTSAEMAARQPEPIPSTSRASISRTSIPRACHSRATTSRASNYRENLSRNSTNSISRGTNTTQTSIRAIKRRKLEIGIRDVVRLNYTCSELFGLLKKFKYAFTGIDDYYDDDEYYPCLVAEDVLTEVKDEVEVTTTEIMNYDDECGMSDYSNRSEDNVLISNRYNNVSQQNEVLKEKNKVVSQPRRSTRASVRDDEKPSGSGLKPSESKPKASGSGKKSFVSLQKSIENAVKNNNNIKTDNEWVPIGSGMTFVHRDEYRKINFKSYTSATRGLLQAVFSRKTLATHSLTGKPSPAFMNKPAKMCLDPKKVSDIMYEVASKCGVKESFVRTVITTKCADECKMYRMRMEKRKKQRRSMPANQENEPPREDATPKLKGNQANQTCPI